MEIEVPDGWFVKESITLLSPDGQANLILSSEPLDPSISTDEYATVQGDLLSTEFPGFQEFSLEPFGIGGGGSGWLRIFEWTPPDSVPVTQAQVYYAANGRGYTSTVTTPSSNYDAFRDTFRIALQSIAVRSPSVSD